MNDFFLREWAELELLTRREIAEDAPMVDPMALPRKLRMIYCVDVFEKYKLWGRYEKTVYSKI